MSIKAIRIHVTQCSKCSGTGLMSDGAGHMVDCKGCDGKGIARQRINGNDGRGVALHRAILEPKARLHDGQ